MRNLFKKLVPKDVAPLEWYTGDDVPLTWEPKELHKMRMKTLRYNRDSGYLSHEQFKEMKHGYQRSAEKA